MRRPRLLITGAGGLLGQALCQEAVNGWTVIALCRNTVPSIPGVRVLTADITDSPGLGDAFTRARPDAVIHAAALSRPNACELDPETSAAVNLAGTIQLGTRCATAGVPLVFTSTDLVFDGTRPPYGEDDPVSPISVYGRHKSLAEARLKAICPSATICRLPLLFGHHPAGGGFLGELVSTLDSGGRPRLFTDEHRTPLSTRSAARGLLTLLAHPGRLLHLGGGRRVSRYAFGLQVAALMHLPAARILPIRQGDLEMPAPRSPDVSLDNRSARRLGFDPGCFDEDLAAAVGQFTPPAPPCGPAALQAPATH